VKTSSLSFLCPPLNDFPISGRTPFENGSVFGGKVIVTKDIPSNSVAYGVPAKVKMHVDTLYKNYRERELIEAINYYYAIKQRGLRVPVEKDFKEFFYLFCTGSRALECGIDVRTQTTDRFYDLFLKQHKPQFDSFEAFSKYCEDQKQ
jgi:hypothetical protein